MTTIDTIITAVKTDLRLTDAEFDYALSRNDCYDINAIFMARVYDLANPGWRDEEVGVTAAENRARAEALYDTLRPELDGLITAAKSKKYTGWSAAAQARGHAIEYAS